MIQIAFCDDDQTVLDQLSALLEKYRAQRCVQIQCTAFHSPLDLLAEIEKGTRYDILFLDVIMPAENGITAAKEIRQYDNVVKIIFLTSSAEFAVESYVVGAYFYQLKPIWEDSFFRLTQQVPVSMIAVDEAHCVSQWGQDFRQSYLDIPVFMEQLPARPICTAFTATATKQVEADIARILKLQEPEIIHTGFDRKNLFFGVRRPNNKTRELFQLLRENDGKSGIVYCSTRKAVEEVCDALRENGFPATRYHAGLSDTERAQNQDDFLYDRQPIMVATNAFGMGIDKSNVSFVIHYNMPMDLESYYQEAGRAGRDGSPAQCILLYSGKDVRTNDFLLQRSRETTEVEDEETRQFLLEQGKERLKQMTFYATSTTCLRHRMLQYFGDHSPDSCGNCSCCLTNYREEDATTAAKKIISCVYRAQKGGYHLSRTMTADVLMGSKKESLLRMRLDQLSTYGIIEKLSRREVMQLIDELIQREDLALRQFQEYQELVLTAGSVEIIRDQKTVMRRVPVVREKLAAPVGTKDPTLSAADNDLFQKLRQLRAAQASTREYRRISSFPMPRCGTCAGKSPRTSARCGRFPVWVSSRHRSTGKCFWRSCSSFWLGYSSE